MNNQIRVRIFFSQYTSTGLRNAVCSTFAVKDFKFKHIQFVDDETYTHAIIINCYTFKMEPKIKKLPKRNVLGLAWEPPILLSKSDTVKDFAKKRIGKFLVGHSMKDFPKCYVNYYGFITHLPVQPKPDKTQFMSIIVSNKRQLHGHIYRHMLILEILKTDLNIHIYGRGANKYNDDRVKGDFISDEPYKNYTHTIAIENKQYNHYISEKFSSPIALNCIPIYLGCPNVKNYFGKDCHVKLTGDVKNDMILLHDIFNNKDKYLLNLDTARNHILNGKASLPVFLSKYWKQK